MSTTLARFAMSASLVTALAVAPEPARADDDCRGMPVSRAQAIDIARSVGLVRVEEVDCDDDEWEVEGRHADGREMEVEISARSGRILEIEYDD